MGIDHSLVAQIVFGSRMGAWRISRIMQYATAFEMTQTNSYFPLRRAVLGLLRITPRGCLFEATVLAMGI
jgi:hypothetical protein